MTQREYITHVLPLEPGPRGKTAEILTRLGAEGWRVVSTHPLMLAGGQVVVPGVNPTQQMGLFVVLERCLGADDRPGGDAPGAAAVGYPRY